MWTMVLNCPWVSGKIYFLHILKLSVLLKDFCFFVCLFVCLYVRVFYEVALRFDWMVMNFQFLNSLIIKCNGVENNTTLAIIYA